MELSKILVYLPWNDLYGILHQNEVLQTMKNPYFVQNY